MWDFRTTARCSPPSRHWQAVAATPSDNPDLIGRLNNLGNILERRFERTGKIEDPEEVIWRAEQAVVATLNNLGNQLESLFEQTGRMEDKVSEK